jgi:hypothetical protein
LRKRVRWATRIRFLVQRHRYSDRSQDGPLHFEKALGGDGSTERLPPDIILLERCDLLAFEHRRLRNASVAATQSNVCGSSQKASRARYDDDVGRELVADVGGYHEN